MNLQLRMYVRTCNGTIFKIVGGNEDKWDIDISYSCLSRLEGEDYTSYAYNKNNSFFKVLAKKASHNLIDLIEVGDYILVDGEDSFLKVKYIDDCEGSIRQLYFDEKGENIGFWNSDIREVITKEQFESIKYEVKDD